MMTFIPLYSLDVGNRDLGITKSRSLISNIIMAKTSACSEEVCFFTYLKKFKRKGTSESKGTPKLLSDYLQLVESIQ